MNLFKNLLLLLFVREFADIRLPWVFIEMPVCGGQRDEFDDFIFGNGRDFFLGSYDGFYRFQIRNHLTA